MKKLTKTLLTVSGICGGTGVVLLTAGVLMGARGDRFWDALSIQASEVQKWYQGGSEKSEESTMKTEDQVTYSNQMGNLTSDDWNIQVFSNIRDLDVDLGARELYVESYNGGEIQVYVEKEDECVKVRQENNELKLRMEKFQGNSGKKGYAVKILIPENYQFDEVNISVGAGEAYIETLQAKSIEAETGAGSIVSYDRIETKESSWTVAAGSISLTELQSEETEIDCAAGNFDAVFTGSEKDYRIDGDIGVGSITVGDSSWEALGKDISVGNKNAKKTIDADCAAGSVGIDFTEK